MEPRPLTFVNIDSASGWDINSYVPRGNREKRLCVAPVMVGAELGSLVWYWKASLPRYPVEYWSEVAAYHIGCKLDVPVPICYPAVCEGQIGSISASMLAYSVDPSGRLDRLEVLEHGGDIFQQADPFFDRRRGERHSTMLVISSLHRLGEGRQYRHLFQYLVFDAIIGNSDRHQENWGLIRNVEESSDERLRLSLAFDNGSSLGRELTEEALKSYVSDDHRLDSYITRGKAHMRWEDQHGLVHVSHEEFIRRHFALFPLSVSYARNLFNRNLDDVVSSVHEVSGFSRRFAETPISPLREEFMVKSMSRRWQRLIAILEEAS